MQAKSIFNNVYTSKYFANLPDFQQQRTQSILTLTFTLVALSVFGIFAITPTVTTILELQKQKEDNAFVEEKISQKKANLAALSQSYALLEPDLRYVFNAIPQTPDIPNLTGKLYALGKSANVEITRIQSSEVDLTKSQEGPQKFSSFPVTIEATGSYPALKQYIDSLGTFDRILTITSLAITKGQTGVLKLNIQAKAYFKL